jgi:hypothetical protein
MRATLIHLKTCCHVFEAEHGSDGRYIEQSRGSLNVAGYRVRLTQTPTTVSPGRVLTHASTADGMTAFGESAPKMISADRTETLRVDLLGERASYRPG